MVENQIRVLLEERSVIKFLLGWLIFGFYGISTIVDYLMPNPFLYKQTVLFQTIQ